MLCESIMVCYPVISMTKKRMGRPWTKNTICMRNSTMLNQDFTYHMPFKLLILQQQSREKKLSDQR